MLFSHRSVRCVCVCVSFKGIECRGCAPWLPTECSVPNFESIPKVKVSQEREKGGGELVSLIL